MHVSVSSPNCVYDDENEAHERSINSRIVDRSGQQTGTGGRCTPQSIGKAHYARLRHGAADRAHLYLFGEHLSAGPQLSASLHGLSSAATPNRQKLVYSGPLEKRHNRSCDWSPTQAFGNDLFSLRSVNNPIAQVSTDILRVSGYTNQFKNLLSGRTRRESYQDGSHGALATHTPEEKPNGDVRFAEVTDAELATKRNSSSKLIRRRQSGYGITITSDSTAKMRCRQRKQLFQRRNKICDLSLILGLLGLILVVIDTELTALHIVSKYSVISLAIRTLVVASTLALICSLINYHRIEVKIALIDSGADDWRVALTTERIIKLGIEISICSLCPFPGSGDIHWAYFRPQRDLETVAIPLDVMLSIPMYLRAYLLCRFMDAATRSIAALNRISMDFRFVIKTMMSDHPLSVLVVFTVSYWICMAWMFTQCERYNQNVPPQHYYMNSLWFIMVTFMSIGYGDLVPATHCGRALAITTGIVGGLISSALIAVISRKLELSKAEKQVNNFIQEHTLLTQRKNAAACVLQHTWFIHRYQQTPNKGDDIRLRQHQRKFLNSINEFRRIKWDQRKLQEKSNSLLDVGKLHNEMHDTLWEMHRTQDQFISQIDMLTQRIMELQAVVLGQQQNQLSSQQNTQQPTQPISIQPTQTFQPPVAGNLSPQGHQFQQPQSPLGSAPYATFQYQRANSPHHKRRDVLHQQTMPTTAITITGDSPNSCVINTGNRNGTSQEPRGNGGLVHQRQSIDFSSTPKPTISNVQRADESESNANTPLIDREPPV
ncbi:CaMBD domain-containing protein [Aphelenchoides besseyi]|nr:CaMBD domain-containing protein [Aphelenchoides besseyi]